MDSVKALLKQITAFWEARDKRFRRTVIIVAAALVVVIVVSSVLLNQTPYAVLYSGLDAQDAGAVLSALNDQKIEYRVSGDAILVPAGQADSLRLSLSTQVKNGFNLDILKQGQGLGLTESDKQDYRRYQIQSDIRNSLLTLEGVRDARVAVTMSEDSVLVLDANRREATAGVILTMQPGVEPSAAQVKSIALFVQKSVPGLKLDNISIMDSSMRFLDFTATEDAGATASDRYALQYDVQSKLRKQIMALLQPVFGLGRVEAQVNVTLGFDERTVDTVKFEPVVDSKNGIVVSIDKLREQIVNGPAGSGQPGTDANTGADAAATASADAGTPTYPVLSTDNGTYEKNAEKINYEINSIKEHLQEEKGAVKSLSVSVVIDSTNLKDDYTENVKNLVATAVGVDRGLISVEYLPMVGAQAFAEAVAGGGQAPAAPAGQSVPLIAAVGAAVLFFAVMLILLAARRAKEKALLEQQAAMLAAEASARAGQELAENEADDIKIVKDSGTREQIGKLIEKNPELVANLLRSWLADEQE